MRNLFNKIRKSKNTSEILEAVKIAAAMRMGDPYAHHWYRQLNGTLVCHKCGDVHLCRVFDGRVYNKCTVHTDHPGN